MGDLRTIDFIQSVYSKDQEITFCGVGAHCQNGLVKGKNQVLAKGARILLLHARRMWPQMIDSVLWLSACKTVSERLIFLYIDLDGLTPHSQMNRLEASEVLVKTYNTIFPSLCT